MNLKLSIKVTVVASIIPGFAMNRKKPKK